MITIHQIRLSDSDVNKVNAGETVPKVEAWRTMMFNGASAWKDEYAEFYTAVYEVDTNDLDDAMRLTNLWDDESAITRLVGPAASTSMGDIMVLNGTAHIVDTFGFSEMSQLPF